MAVAIMNPDTMRRMMKLVISTLMLAISLYLIIWWFFTPTMFGWTIEMLVTQHTQKFGDMVGVYMLYTCPVIIFALLGTLHLHLTKKCPPLLKSNNDSFYARASRMWRMLWTRPVFINRVFGVMVGVDLVAIVSTLVLVSGYSTLGTCPRQNPLTRCRVPPERKKWWQRQCKHERCWAGSRWCSCRSFCSR